MPWNGVLLLETSEEVSLAKLTAALSSGGLTLTDLDRQGRAPWN